MLDYIKNLKKSGGDVEKKGKLVHSTPSKQGILCAQSLENAQQDVELPNKCAALTEIQLKTTNLTETKN